MVLYYAQFHSTVSFLQAPHILRGRCVRGYFYIFCKSIGRRVAIGADDASWRKSPLPSSSRWACPMDFAHFNEVGLHSSNLIPPSNPFDCISVCRTRCVSGNVWSSTCSQRMRAEDRFIMRSNTPPPFPSFISQQRSGSLWWNTWL